MYNKRLTRALQGLAVSSAVAWAPMAAAIDWTVSGFIRQEAAYKLGSGDENFWNQGGNTFNGKAQQNLIDGQSYTRFQTNPIVPIFTFDSQAGGYGEEDNDWNLMATRAELDIEATFNPDLKFFTKIRGYFDWDIYDGPDDVNYFEVPFRGDCGTRLEICDEDYMIDLPSAYLDYNNGSLWLRAGNQQIAWGESIFFRVLDVPNGVDLRRHSVLDIAAEEYSDKRVSGLGLRGSYRFKSDWELEGFVQEFNPSILPNENTPYNVIASQFVVQQESTFNVVDDEFNYGMRLRGQVGELGMQFMAVSRRNPDGVYRWTTSKVNPFEKQGLPDNGTGAILAGTPFEPFTGLGVYGHKEWFTYAGRSRLDGVDGVQSSIDEFPASQLLSWGEGGAVDICTGAPQGDVDTYDEAACVLDIFFSEEVGLGNLRGHIERVYRREEIFGFGLNYVFFADPDSFLDQLVVRFEATYTPDKEFTNIALRQEFDEEDEYVTGLVFEKYHRFSQEFPATFMVLQWMYKSESDMFSRQVSGYEADGDNSPPDGRDDFHALAFAFQQPFPNLIWRADFAILYDPEGGYLVQPGLRWKPSRSFTVEGFVNIVEGTSDNKDMLGTLEWTDEVALRLTYQF